MEDALDKLKAPFSGIGSALNAYHCLVESHRTVFWSAIVAPWLSTAAVALLVFAVRGCKKKVVEEHQSSVSSRSSVSPVPEPDEQEDDDTPDGAVSSTGSTLVQITIYVFFLVYEDLVTRIMYSLECDGVGPLDNTGNRSVLVADTRVFCHEGEHVNVYRSGLVFLLVYGLGPCVAVWMLQAWKDPDFTQMRHKTSPFVRSFGFLYSGYRTNSRVTANWESLVLLRKFCVVGIAVFIDSDALQSNLAAWVIVFALVVQVAFHPFEDPLLNKMETLGLVAVYVTQSASMYYYVVMTDDRYEMYRDAARIGVTAVLVFMNLGLSVWFVVNIVRAKRAELTNKKRDTEEQDQPCPSAVVPVTATANSSSGSGNGDVDDGVDDEQGEELKLSTRTIL